jgi:FMN phosphatase YigB (HAD superfamily)
MDAPAEVTASRLRVAAITIDFGNTLVRVDQPGLRAIVGQTADSIAARGVRVDREAFIAAWAEERERQFREEVPVLREPDLEVRAKRVLARLRGVRTPREEERWDDRAAAEFAPEAEIAGVVEAYAAAFVSGMEPVPKATETLVRLSTRGFALAILSNWPLASIIDRFAAANGWMPCLRAIVVSQRVGWIKPHAAIFRAAEEALGMDQGSGRAILHVGYSWAADVVGASRAGWRTAYLRNRQAGSALPTSEPGDGVAAGEAPIAADLVIDELAELDALVDLAPT